MKIEWLLLAEGIAQDARGVVSTIGINQNVVVAPTLPANTKRVILAHLTFGDEEELAGKELRFAFRLESPAGKALAAASGAAKMGERPLPNIPASVDIPAELAFAVTEYGEFRFVLEITSPSGEEASAHASLWVIEPQQGVGEEQFARAG